MSQNLSLYAINMNIVANSTNIGCDAHSTKTVQFPYKSLRKHVSHGFLTSLIYRLLTQDVQPNLGTCWHNPHKYQI